MDTRELVLSRVQDCVKTLAPGVVYTFPGGMLHAPIVSDLNGRCYSKMRAEVNVDSSCSPYVEIVTNAATVDAIEVGDDDVYFDTMTFDVWGYCYAGDQGDGLDSVVRPTLNQLRADLLIAVSAFPYWTGTAPNQLDSLLKRIGNVIVNLTAQWTDPSTEAPYGQVHLIFTARWPFNKRFP